jgi:hypothetical protein
MTLEVDDGSQWERVAAELRACREAQRRAWGDLDNATLGRYLAGDVDAEERQHIESALEALPELRKLTDLVRDVLSETDDIAAERQSTPSDPAVLPFAAPRASITPSRPTASWPTRTAASRFRQRVGLAAAACLLLALGVAFPRAAGESAPRSELALAMSQPVAMRGPVLEDMPVEAKGVLFQGIAAKSLDAESMQRSGEWLARFDASVQALEADGKKHEAERLARQYADNLTRKAKCYQEKGDLIRAEPALQQAHTLCVRMWGPEAPETARTSNSLALVYESALNAANPEGVAHGSQYEAHVPGAVNPYLGGTEIPASPYSPYSYKDAATTSFAMSASSLSVGDKAPAQYSSSSYESATQPRSAPPSAKSAPRRTLDTYKVRSAQQAQKARHAAHHAMTTSSTAFVSLRDHLTSQSQVALKTTVVPVLTQALREATSAEERQRLAHALGQLGPAARDAVPVLVDCCRHAKDASERANLLLVLGEMGPAARPAVPVLVEALQNDSPTVRDYAARALVQLGPTARSCRTELVKQSADDPLVRDVLFRLDGPEGRCGIDDEVECFSLKAINESEHEIRQLASTSRIVLNVSTGPDKVARAPAADDWFFERSDVPKPNEKKDWEKTRVRTNGEVRVYFRIHKDAADVQVFVSDALQKRGLTVTRLRSVIEPHLRTKDFDGGLREAVKLVARLDREHGAK